MSEFQQAVELVKTGVEAANEVEKLGVMGMSMLINIILGGIALTMYRKFDECSQRIIEMLTEMNRD